MLVCEKVYEDAFPLKENLTSCSLNLTFIFWLPKRVGNKTKGEDVCHFLVVLTL